jgi:glycosyltransferase involved in cell wall biosynthesis
MVLMDDRRVFVCIITWNRHDLVQRCAESLLPAIEAHGAAELIILDQGSMDGTPAWLQAFAAQHDPVIDWCATSNQGVSGGRQRLHDYLRGRGLHPQDIVIHLDSDTVAQRETWLDELLTPFEDETIWAVGKQGSWIEPDWAGFTAGPVKACETDVLSGGLTAYRGRVALDLEYDSATFGRFWHEDSDLALQIRAAGGRCWCLPALGLKHDAEHGYPDAAFYLNLEHLRRKWQGRGLVRIEQGERPGQHVPPLTWVGEVGAPHAFPLVNEGLVRALWRQGYTVQVNNHLCPQSPALTDLAVRFEYPPQPPAHRHEREVCLSVWEFGGDADGVPASFGRAFDQYDIVITPCEWTAQQYREVTQTPVRVARFLGIDPKVYQPDGESLDLRKLFRGQGWVEQAAHVLLMVGGSDPRHGWDVAVRVLDRLPGNVHLLAKVSAAYPADRLPQHDRLHPVRGDLPSLAPLYRAVDGFLLTARGVGFSLPVLEALACGLPVAAPDLPPLHEYATDRIIFAPGSWVPMGKHHLHDDCAPLWFEPDVERLALAALAALRLGKADQLDEDWVARWSWDTVAAELMEVIGEH